MKNPMHDWTFADWVKNYRVCRQMRESGFWPNREIPSFVRELQEHFDGCMQVWQVSNYIVENAAAVFYDRLIEIGDIERC